MLVVGHSMYTHVSLKVHFQLDRGAWSPRHPVYLIGCRFSATGGLRTEFRSCRLKEPLLFCGRNVVRDMRTARGDISIHIRYYSNNIFLFESGKYMNLIAANMTYSNYS